jgi:hypothetical protein
MLHIHVRLMSPPVFAPTHPASHIAKEHIRFSSVHVFKFLASADAHSKGRLKNVIDDLPVSCKI